MNIDFFIALLLSQTYCNYYYDRANPFKVVPTQ